MFTYSYSYFQPNNQNEKEEKKNRHSKQQTSTSISRHAVRKQPRTYHKNNELAKRSLLATLHTLLYSYTHYCRLVYIGFGDDLDGRINDLLSPLHIHTNVWFINFNDDYDVDTSPRCLFSLISLHILSHRISVLQAALTALTASVVSSITLRLFSQHPIWTIHSCNYFARITIYCLTWKIRRLLNIVDDCLFFAKLDQPSWCLRLCDVVFLRRGKKNASHLAHIVAFCIWFFFIVSLSQQIKVIGIRVLVLDNGRSGFRQHSLKKPYLTQQLKLWDHACVMKLIYIRLDSFIGRHANVRAHALFLYHFLHTLHMMASPRFYSIVT